MPAAPEPAPTLPTLRILDNIIYPAIGDFGVKGNPPFQNDTLVHVGELQVDLNILSVIFSDKPSLEGIRLKDGQIYVKVLEDGEANYDIAYESAVEEPVDTTSSDFQLGIESIEIEHNSIWLTSATIESRSFKYFSFKYCLFNSFTFELRDLLRRLTRFCFL